MTDKRAKAADALAAAATKVAADAADKTSLDLRDVTSPIDLSELNDRVTAFRELITSWPRPLIKDVSSGPPQV